MIRILPKLLTIMLFLITSTCQVYPQSTTVYSITSHLSQQFSMPASLVLNSAVSETFVGGSRHGNTLIQSGFLSSVPHRESVATFEEQKALPLICTLHQNYPNPFNPSTTIRFELPRPMSISLIVTDAFGREVTKLINAEERLAGQHSVSFNSQYLPSGVYFYHLETEGAVLVKKMVVMK